MRITAIDLAVPVTIKPNKLKRLFHKMYAIWNQVPTVECKGLCQDQCANVPVNMIEALYLERKYDIELPAAVHGLDEIGDFYIFKTLGVNQFCPFLTEPNTNGKCKIYADRPLICRAWGHDAVAMHCRFGCKVKTDLPVLVFKSMLLGMQKVTDHYRIPNWIRKPGPMERINMTPEINDTQGNSTIPTDV